MGLGLHQEKTGRGAQESARDQAVAGGHGGWPGVEQERADRAPSAIKCHQTNDATTTTVAAKQMAMR